MRSRIVSPQRALGEALRSGADELGPRAEALAEEQAALERQVRMLRQARARGWAAAAAEVRRRVIVQAARVRDAAEALAKGGFTPGGMNLQRPEAPPPLGELVADLMQLQEEFEGSNVGLVVDRVIAADTRPVTFCGVYLGPFTIRLHLSSLGTRANASAFEVVAVEPNPASSSEDVTHPHVSGGSLCSGEAAVPIACALAEGRVADAFCLVRSVLNTYNPASAYVSLDQWEGSTCGDCGQVTSPDELYYCEGCGSEFCDGCVSACDRCGRPRCLGCLEEDARERRLCGRCRGRCGACGEVAASDELSPEEPGEDGTAIASEGGEQPPQDASTEDAIHAGAPTTDVIAPATV
jgi:hypothetical protein